MPFPLATMLLAAFDADDHCMDGGFSTDHAVIMFDMVLVSDSLCSDIPSIFD